MTSTKFITLAALFAVTNAGFRGEPGYAIPEFARRGTPAVYRTTPAYTGAPTSMSPSSMSTATGNDGDSTARMDSRPMTTTDMPVTDSRYQGSTDHDDNPSYSYAYDVKNAETGDTKAHSESLENGVVKGSYSVVDPDGIRRTVHYTADAVSGFNAVVRMEPSDVVIPKPKSDAPQYDAETSTESGNPTTPSPASTVADALAEARGGSPRHQQAVFAAPVVYRTAPAVYRPPVPRILYAPVVNHRVPHPIPRIAISTTPVALAVQPVQRAIYG